MQWVDKYKRIEGKQCKLREQHVGIYRQISLLVQETQSTLYVLAWTHNGDPVQCVMWNANYGVRFKMPYHVGHYRVGPYGEGPYGISLKKGYYFCYFL